MKKCLFLLLLLSSLTTSASSTCRIYVTSSSSFSGLTIRFLNQQLRSKDFKITNNHYNADYFLNLKFIETNTHDRLNRYVKLELFTYNDRIPYQGILRISEFEKNHNRKARRLITQLPFSPCHYNKNEKSLE